MVEEGKLTTDSGERVKLSDFRGQPVVLYFYPKDDARGSQHSKRITTWVVIRGGRGYGGLTAGDRARRLSHW